MYTVITVGSDVRLYATFCKQNENHPEYTEILRTRKEIMILLRITSVCSLYVS